MKNYTENPLPSPPIINYITIKSWLELSLQTTHLHSWVIFSSKTRKSKYSDLLVAGTIVFRELITEYIPRVGVNTRNRSAIFHLYSCLSYLAVCLFYCLSVRVTVYLSVYMSIYLSVYLSISLSVYLSIVYLSICLSVYLSICLSVYLSIFLYVYLSICLSVYLFIYLSVCLSRTKCHLSLV